MRAYFVAGASSPDAAQRFGYTPGSFRTLAHPCRRDPPRSFSRPPRAHSAADTQRDEPRQRVSALPKQNLSLDDRSRAREHAGQSLSPVAVAHLLTEEGFARLPRRRDAERPPGTRPTPAAVAGVRQLDLSPRPCRTRFGGLCLFRPELVPGDLDALLRPAGFPGPALVPAGCAVRALLALKLFGNARHSHVLSHVLDAGRALFAGRNVVPTRSCPTGYSCRLVPASYPERRRGGLGAVRRRGLRHGGPFDLDVHTLPFHGDDALVAKHSASKRSRRPKGILALLAQDADPRASCDADADLRRGRQNDASLDFVAFWQERTGRPPADLIFDSRLTTYANLNRLHERGIRFITLRRRSAKLLRDLARQPVSAWRRIGLGHGARAYRHPRLRDQQARLKDYQGPVRPLAVADLGHAAPTLLLSNQRRRSPVPRVGRYAQRLPIANAIEDGRDFFHMEALSSAVALQVPGALQRTLRARGL